MASLNKVILMGNVTRDLEVRYTPNGAAVCDMGLAINRRFGGEGQEREETTFVDIVVWNKQAETCSRYLKKGSQCLVEGRLQLDTWDDKETGQKRSRMRVVAERVQFLGGRGDNASAGQSQYQQQPQAGFVGQQPQAQQPYQAQQVPPAPQVQQPVANPAFGTQQQSQAAQPVVQPMVQPQTQQHAVQQQPMQQPVPQQAPPAMPDNAFNVSNSVEDDIPF